MKNDDLKKEINNMINEYQKAYPFRKDPEDYLIDMQIDICATLIDKYNLSKENENYIHDIVNEIIYGKD